jgi:hypothetical protein
MRTGSKNNLAIIKSLKKPHMLLFVMYFSKSLRNGVEDAAKEKPDVY